MPIVAGDPLDIFLDKNVGDKVFLFWRSLNRSSTWSFRLYYNNTGHADPYVQIKEISNTPEPATSPFVGNIGVFLSRVNDLTALETDTLFFKITSVSNVGVESLIASSPIRTVFPSISALNPVNISLSTAVQKFSLGFIMQDVYLYNVGANEAVVQIGNNAIIVDAGDTFDGRHMYADSIWAWSVGGATTLRVAGGRIS